MTASENKVSRLLDLVKRPQQAKRKPSNFALYWAWLFYNGVALLFDVIAATTVYGLVGKFVYAILTFAAGFAPLLMHEFLYTRAFANWWQKVLAVVGAVVSVATILTVGLIAGVINVIGFTAVTDKTLELVLIGILVVVAGTHALIAAVYFYIDDGIKAMQVRAESMAYHERRLDDINRAKEILASAELGRTEEDKIAETYGTGAREVLNEILGQLRGDAVIPEAPATPVVTTPQPIPQQPIPYVPLTVPQSTNESEAAELQPVPLPRSLPSEELTGAGFLTGMGSDGNGHHPNGIK